MPVRPCSNCLNPTARFLEGPSADARVRYYRCERCGHVFAIANDDLQGPARTITPGKKLTPEEVLRRRHDSRAAFIALWSDKGPVGSMPTAGTTRF